MHVSETQLAKRLYEEIRISDQGRTEPLIGLYKYNGIWYWLGHKARAYQLKELSNSHLARIIKAMYERHPDDLRTPLLRERLRRRYEFWAARANYKAEREEVYEQLAEQGFTGTREALHDLLEQYASSSARRKVVVSLRDGNPLKELPSDLRRQATERKNKRR